MRNHRLKERRESLGLSQRQLAEASDYPTLAQATVSQAELRGKPSQVWRVRRTLVKLELARRVARQIATHQTRWRDAEQGRVAEQEALWASLPECPAKAALQAAMLDRCIDLMDAGQGEACDAIAEWLPPDQVRAMFDRWEGEER